MEVKGFYKSAAIINLQYLLYMN